MILLTTILPRTVIWWQWNVTSLHTNIPITDCLVAIDLFVETMEYPAHVSLIVELSRLVLTNNYFDSKLQEKAMLLEEHSTKGMVPRDLMLPAKKPLFEDDQVKWMRSSNQLWSNFSSNDWLKLLAKLIKLSQKKTFIGTSLLSTLEAARDSQLNGVSAGDVQTISMIKNCFLLNVRFFRSQLAIMSENAFLKCLQLGLMCILSESPQV